MPTILLLFLPINILWAYQNPASLSDSVHVLELNRRAEAFRYKKPDSIKILAKVALELSKELNYEKGILYSTYNLATHELFQGNTSKSLEYNIKITKHPNFLEYPEIAIKVYNDMAQAYYINAEHPKAYEYFLMAEFLAVKKDVKPEIIRMNNNLGTMFLLLGDFDESINYYEKAQKFFKEETPSHIRGLILSNLGYLNMKKNNLDVALDYLKQGMNLIQKTEYSTLIAFNYLTSGEVYNLKKDYNKALEFYEKANSEYVINGDKKGIADLYLGQAKVHKELGNISLAKEQVLKSLDVYTSFSLKSGLEKCFRLLYQIAKLENDTESSLIHLEKAEAYSDSISKEQNKTNIAMLKAKLDFEEEKEQLEQNSLATIERQKNYIGWSMITLVVAIIIIVLIYNSSKKRKELNKSLAQNEKKLHETNQTKDKLFSIVGHDLRGPIVSLKGLLKLSLEEKNGENQFQRFGPKLQQDLDHIQFTLDNLLNWGQTQMQGAIMKVTKIYVKNELHAIGDLFNENLLNKKIGLINNLEKEMCIKADLNHFRIIFRNLISNAIKFTPKNGSIILNGKVKENLLIVSVEDNGVGMNPETIQKIWDTKEHISTYGTQDEKGTGLGLTLCKEMAEKNMGFISVTSQIGQGSVFKVGLPLCK